MATVNYGPHTLGPITANGAGKWGTAPPVPFFTDDFASGDLTKTTNGFVWGAPSNTSVSTDNPRTGTYSLKFDYAYLQSGEQRFNMGALYSEFTMEYYLYIPDGTEAWGGLIYEHYNSDGGSDNNKSGRFWDTNTEAGNPEKLGISTRAATAVGISKILAEWNDGLGGGLTSHEDADNWINAADRGNWIKVKVYHKAATSADNDGIFRVYKNDILFIDRTDVDNYDAAGDHAWQNGYLLGIFNGVLPNGPDHMYLYIDDINYWAGEV